MADDYQRPKFYQSDSLNSSIDSALDFETSSELKTSDSLTSLQHMLTAIQQERNRDSQTEAKLAASTDYSYYMIPRDAFWTKLFHRHFLDIPENSDSKDDILCYVRKSVSKSHLDMPQTEVEVYRKSSKNLPSISDLEIDWEETVYLNLIMQHFEYFVTCAVCCRTGDKELQILRKSTQKVFASPSRRRMDSKGTREEITYPNIFFTVDNFDEVFTEMVVRDPEIVCVELVAKDREGRVQGVVFLGSIRYEALKRVYDSRASLSHRMVQKMSLGWFAGSQGRTEFIRMRGPQGKGHAEMAISRLTTEPEPSEPVHLDNQNEVEEDSFARRRMSDPSQIWPNNVYGKSGLRRSRSEIENVDSSGLEGEVEASTVQEELEDSGEHYHGFFGKSFGQAWSWFKDRRRANCVPLNAYLTYVTLPWHRIIADILEENGPLLQAIFLAAPVGSTCTNDSSLS